MKAINKIWVFALGTAVMVSCSDLDTFPESGIVTEDQKKEVVEDNPERLQADINTLSSIFTKLLPNWAGGSATPFHNDFSYPAVCIATDGNGADMVSDNSDYEWFSVAFEYSDRNANYAVPMFTWNFCYKLNKQANDILSTIPADTENQTLIYYRGQASGGACVRQLHAGAAFPVHLQGQRGQTDGTHRDVGHAGRACRCEPPCH